MSTPTPSGSPSHTLVGALQQALAGEHAAIYAYGLLGAHLPDPARKAAQDDYVTHLRRRDELVLDLRGLGATPVAPEAAYDPPFPVSNQRDARRLAALVEDRMCAVYADLVAAATGTRRSTGARRMQECAVRAATWRGRSAGPFPGLGERR